ncbi:MAG: hydantoinase B/oxoprolinase family protein, partial [Phenylobacterium sp.]|nr:hydantoinase B/oxoprolinase family protein [Phenylobacterium sp.]
AAGQVACQTAEALGVTRVLCPRYGSLLSAYGIGQAQVRALRQGGLEQPLDAEGLGAADRLAQGLLSAAAADLAGQGAVVETRQVTLRLRYDGADAELPVAPGEVPAVRAAFEAAHTRLFGFIEPDRQILIAAVEAEVSDGQAPGPEADAPMSSSVPAETRFAEAFIQGRAVQVPVVEAGRLTALEGPALIIRSDTQIALAPGWRAQSGEDGLIILQRLEREDRQTTSGGDLAIADPITLELFNRRFMGVAEAMGAALERTAQSVNIKERLDFSCALFDPDGGLVANAPHMPVHLGSMGASVRAVRDRHPVLAPGQAFALNNPYAGGTHLPDITVVMPIFVGGAERPSFYVAARGHHADVGGVQPGSMPPFSTHIDEEGVLLDALPIMAGGQFLEAPVRAALTAGPWPSRGPARNIADLKAQIAACRAGGEAVAAMIESFGAATVEAYMGHVQANATAAVRRAIGRLRDGAATTQMDGGATIAVEIKVDPAAGRAVLDFTGSSDQVTSNFNAPASIVDAAALYVFRTLVDDDIPLNAGCLAPLEIRVRKGSLLDPAPGAAVVAGNVETSQHVVDVLYAALGVMAGAQGTMNNFTFGDETRQYYETLCGGAGATATTPGADGVHTHMTNSRLTDPEILERRFPVRLEHFGLRAGSGGAGAQRGGDGVVRRLRFLAPMEAALLSSRRTHPPAGLAGGGAGAAGRQALMTAAGEVKELSGCFSVAVAPGDTLEIQTPGGGGYGSAAST